MVNSSAVIMVSQALLDFDILERLDPVFLVIEEVVDMFPVLMSVPRICDLLSRWIAATNDRRIRCGRN